LRFLARDLAAARQLIVSLTMSEREAFARAEALGAATRELLSLLSHELRTPLQAIFGYTGLLEAGVHGTLNEDQLLDVSRIQESQKELLGMLNTVLQRVRTERLSAGRE
jgi:signal transduction histidine kinase